MSGKGADIVGKEATPRSEVCAVESHSVGIHFERTFHQNAETSKMNALQ